MTTAQTRPTIDARPPAQRPRPSAPAAVQIDPIRILRQHVWGIAAAAVLGVVMGGAATIVLEFVYPLYSGRVVFELVPAPDEVGDVIVRDQRTEEAVERLGQTESARIKARMLLMQAMSRGDIAQTGWAQGFIDSSGNFDLNKAVDELEESLGASHMRRTNFFALNWSTHASADVPVVLNAIADTYLEVRRGEDNARFEQNRGTFEAQLNRLDQDILALGNELRKFVEDNNLTGTREDRSEKLIRVEDTGMQLTQTQSQLTFAESRRLQTERKIRGEIEPTPDDVRRAEDDEQVLRANIRVQELLVELDTYRRKFREGHSAIRSIDARLKAAQNERDLKLQEIVRRNLNADYKEFSDVVESQMAVREKFMAEMALHTTGLKDQTSALAKVEELKERRERLLEARATQLQIVANLAQLKARDDARTVTIAQRAQTPRELSFPQYKVMLPLGGVLGLALFLGVVFLRELLDTRVRTAADLAVMQGVRILGTVPELSDDPVAPSKVERAVLHAPRSVVAESSRQIAGQIAKISSQQGVRTIGFLSGLPGAGTTSVVSNTADSLAAGGRKVLVIDANFRRSNLATAMGVEPDAKGLGDVLHEKATLADAVRRTGGDVDLLAAGTPADRVYELLSGPRFDKVLAEALERYDIILLDLPPAVVAGDAFAVANKIDATVLVVRAMQEQRGLVGRLIGQLSDVRGKCMGVVLNRPQGTAGGYLRKNYEAMATYSAKS
jgi:polysaccharide biosynthesis transport protein